MFTILYSHILYLFAVDEAVELSHQAIMVNMGQICCGGSRTYVQEDIYDEFVKRSVERAKRRTVGDPFDLKNESGAQVSQEQRELRDSVRESER